MTVTDQLAGLLRRSAAATAGVPVTDPRAAVAHDVGVLRAETRLDGVTVSGLVYDVTTGLVHPAARQEERTRG
ncbi:hypothetical protein [Amycolatopsis sp. NPDC098790]|uniref:hypothetical protein n=1 Tax=Amycolatopsis sp. NPDC098790 TaxID=3363939 RepID=UPI00381837CC